MDEIPEEMAHQQDKRCREKRREAVFGAVEKMEYDVYQVKGMIKGKNNGKMGAQRVGAYLSQHPEMKSFGFGKWKRERKP